MIDGDDPIVISLVRQIEDAFGNVRLGGGRSLHQADAIDNYEEADVVAEMRRLDPEVRWQDISDEKLIRFPCVLPFLDAEGFRFYFPRFMMFALRHPNSDSAVPDMTIHFCDIATRSGDYLRLLSAEQNVVICAFAAFHADKA